MTVRKATQFSICVDDRPGMLAEVAGRLADAGVNLSALAGWSKGDGDAVLICVPDDPDRVRQLAADAGVTIAEATVIIVDGEDRIGVGRDLSQCLADAGINLLGCMAQAIGGRYQAVFSVPPSEIERAVSALEGS